MSAHEDSTHETALGQVIRERRINRGLCTRALAGAAGIGRRQLTLIERGEGRPHYRTLRALARALDVPAAVLLRDAEGHTQTHEIAQRAIVLKLLDGEHPRPWTLSELQQASPDIEPGILAEALTQLIACGVAILDSEQIHASRSARRLDTLGMVSI